MPVPRELWYLPRPRRKNKYPGGFPLHFEEKLFKLYGYPEKILQPFGGRASYGVRVDINPDIIADAHNLPFPDNSFDFVLCDPPYSDELSKKLYGTGKLSWNKWVSEAVRVCKPGGYVANWWVSPRPKGTTYDRILQE